MKSDLPTTFEVKWYVKSGNPRRRRIEQALVREGLLRRRVLPAPKLPEAKPLFPPGFNPAEVVFPPGKLYPWGENNFPLSRDKELDPGVEERYLYAIGETKRRVDGQLQWRCGCYTKGLPCAKHRAALLDGVE